MTKEQIKKLYETINFLGFYCTKNGNVKYIDMVKKILPEIQLFVEFFLNENNFENDNSIYDELKLNLIDILKDCISAVKENDRVLLLDALEYGLSEYLIMFLDDEEV